MRRGLGIEGGFLAIKAVFARQVAVGGGGFDENLNGAVRFGHRSTSQAREKNTRGIRPVPGTPTVPCAHGSQEKLPGKLIENRNDNRANREKLAIPGGRLLWGGDLQNSAKVVRGKFPRNCPLDTTDSSQTYKNHSRRSARLCRHLSHTFSRGSPFFFSLPATPAPGSPEFAGFQQLVHVRRFMARPLPVAVVVGGWGQPVAAWGPGSRRASVWPLPARGSASVSGLALRPEPEWRPVSEWVWPPGSASCLPGRVFPPRRLPCLSSTKWFL